MIASSLFFLSSGTEQAQAQTCSWLVDKDGSVNQRWITIDGSVHFYAPEEVGRKILKDLSTLDFKTNEVSILDEKLELKNDIIDFKDIQIEEKNDKIELLSMAHSPPSLKWYERPAIVFVSGVLVASAAYGFWAWTSMKTER